MKFDLRRNALLAALLVLAIHVVNYVMQMVGTAPQTLFATINVPLVGAVNIPTVYSPFGTGVGAKVIGWFSGVIPGFFAPVEGILLLFVSAFLILLAGEFIVDALKLSTFKGKVGRLATIVLVGAIPMYLIIKGLVIPALGVMGVITLIAYTFAAAWLAGFVADTLGVNI